MSCSINSNKVIEWQLDNDHIQNLYQYLYDTREHGGDFPLNTALKRSYGANKTSAGQSDSVNAPDAIVNWHSHPISCYRAEKTIWGWPSGEDMRESIVYGLRGSACHVVPAVEGTYTIQPNPCFVTSLLSLEHKVPWDQRFGVSQSMWGNF